MTSLVEPPAPPDTPAAPDLAADRARRVHPVLRSALATAAAVLGGFAIGGLFLVLAGAEPVAAYVDLFRGAFGSRRAVERVLVEAAPLLLIGLGLGVAYRAKVWNIGAQGQFDAGAITGTTLLTLAPGLGWVLLPTTLFVATLGGAALGWFIGYLKARYDANVVITSLMCNYIVFSLLAWSVRRPLKDPNGFLPASASVPAEARLPLLFGTRVNIGLAIALAVGVGLVWVFRRGVFGFWVDMVGASPTVSEACGIPVRRVIVLASVVSAGLAGLAGGLQLLGTEFRLSLTLSSGVGFTAIVVALLGRGRPLGITAAAIFIAALEVGGDAMQRTQGVPAAAVRVIQALLVIFLLLANRMTERRVS
jgi:general nucleoside transport system permease protein